MLAALDLNWWAVVVAALLSFGTGGLWYSKALFAKPWLQLMGRTEEDVKAQGLLSPGAAMAWALVMAGLTALVMAMLIDWAGAETWYEGALVGGLVGMGIVFTSQFVISAFEARPWGLLWLMVGHQFIEFVVMGVVLAVWQ